MRNLDHGELYPLKFSAIAKEKVWGGHKLARLFPQLVPTDRLVGEAWVVWDQLPIDNGPLRGQKLADLVRDYPIEVLGSRSLHPTRDRLAGQAPAFPLLVKLLDAQDTLSVQVHPDDAYAQAHEGEPFGKAEAWYILDAEPGVRLIHGVRTPLTRTEAADAIRTGTLRDLMDYVEVSAGDVYMNPAGTIHALLEGLLLYEIQQTSDLTYRLYDWDRHDPNRPLHIEKALDVADLEPLDQHKVAPLVWQEPGCTRTLLVACQAFAAEMLQVQSEALERPGGECFHLLTVLEGAGSVRYGPSLAEGIQLDRGDSVLVPAGIEQYQLRAGEIPLTAIKAWVPDLLQDVVVPLRERGIADERIVQLGGDPRTSDLTGHVGS
jgi:mannose-6-phosphate isomerase